MTTDLKSGDVNKLMEYSPGTGSFVWKKSQGRAPVGATVGAISPHGYLQTRINGKTRYLHRVAWLCFYGYMPENQIDHINKIKTDNRIINLREVSPQCNLRNTDNRCTNTSGVKGVYFSTKKQKWQAQIMIDARCYNLGGYEDFEEAVCARLAAEQCLGWAGCNKNSPAYQYVRAKILL